MLMETVSKFDAAFESHLDAAGEASGTLYLTVMANTAGQWRAPLIDCYDQHRRQVGTRSSN